MQSIVSKLEIMSNKHTYNIFGLNEVDMVNTLSPIGA